VNENGGKNGDADVVVVVIVVVLLLLFCVVVLGVISNKTNV